MKTCLVIVATLIFAATTKAQVPLVPEDSGMAVMVGESVDGLNDFIYGPCQIDPDQDYCSFTYHDYENFHFILVHGAPGIQVIFAPKKIGLFRDTVNIHIAYHSDVFQCKGTIWEKLFPFVYHSISDSVTRMIPHFSYTHMQYDSVTRRYRSKEKSNFDLMNNIEDTTLFSCQLLPYIDQLSKSVHVIFDSTNDSTRILLPKVRRVIANCDFITDTMPPFLHDTLVQYNLNCIMRNKTTDSLFQWSGSTLYFDSVAHSTSNVLDRVEDAIRPKVIISDSRITISFVLSSPSSVTLIISDITGKTIERVVENKLFQPGTHQIDYLPHSMASGQYFLSYSTRDGVKVVPFTYLR